MYAMGITGISPDLTQNSNRKESSSIKQESNKGMLLCSSLGFCAHSSGIIVVAQCHYMASQLLNMQTFPKHYIARKFDGELNLAVWCLGLKLNVHNV